MDLKEFNPFIDVTHWYYQAKFLAVKNILVKAKIWPPLNPENDSIGDIGSGSGIFIRAFLDSLKIPPQHAYAVDVSYSQESLGQRGGIYFSRALPEGVRLTYLFFMDILEHIDNEKEFLQEWITLSQAKSYFIFTVPAFKFLWSRHDVFLGHKRRYRLKDIEELVSSCGLDIIDSSYFFATIFPLVFLERKFLEPLCNYLGMYRYQGMKQARPLLNLFLNLILKPEIKIARYNRLFGVSCIIVAAKLN